MMRWPNRAEVCLEAGKTASRRKTKTERRSETGAKGKKKTTPGRDQPEIGPFSAACLAPEGMLDSQQLLVQSILRLLRPPVNIVAAEPAVEFEVAQQSFYQFFALRGWVLFGLQVAL